jgi:GAF domain-containing protein
MAPGAAALRRADVHLLDLGVMLKCTAEANARRDAVVMQQVAQHLSFSHSEYSDKPLEAISAEALDLACEITGSAGGAIYFLSTAGTAQFERLAVREGVGFSYPSNLPLTSGTTVRWATERHRAYQQIGGSSAAGALRRAVDSPGGTELVTPIAGPLADTSAPAVGAIALFHREGETRGYGSYERALVRNVALRLALFRTNTATRQIATAISTLRSRSPRRLQTSQPTANVVRPSWPKDILKATERFEEPLSQLAASTHSHSVTLRIALPDHELAAAHGLSLARVAAYPPMRLDEPFEREREGDPGMHWDVMRDGCEKYASRIGGDSHFVQVRAGTESVLCVPVRIEGILAGTLNLESPFADNYATFLPLVVALAGAVGRTLADARAEIEGDLLDRTAQALARRHEYSGVLSAMRTDLESVEPSELRRKLTGEVDALQTVVQDLRKPDVRPDLTAKSLWDIVQDASQQIQLWIVKERPVDNTYHTPLSPRATEALETVMSSVFRNVNYHSTSEGRDREGQPVPRLKFDRTHLEGVEQAVVIVENLSKTLLRPEVCAELYRYPVEGPHREIRLGTYIAGLNARRVGARIHAVPFHGGQALRTTLIVPVEKLYDRSNPGEDISHPGGG